MSIKYKFTGKEKKFNGVILKQIVCVTAFSSISAGDIGGWIESEDNLSQYGNAWVYGDARVLGNAWVYGDARVLGNANVYGDARVYGNAKVYGNAWVYGDARVLGNAWVYGDAEVLGNAKVYGDAWVYGDARVYGDAEVYGNAKVYGNAWVYGDARVLGNAWVCGDAEVCTKKAYTVSTDMYHVTITDTHITIGCQNHKIDFWRKAGRKDIEDMGGKESADNFMKYKEFIFMLEEQRNGPTT